MDVDQFRTVSILMKEIAYKRIETFKELVASDPYRLHFHIMPPVGLLNDPNGFVFYKGQYHIFYQWNPMETAHGAKFWGHYISDDLVHWQMAPVALAPDQWYDKNGCYSGSAVVHDDTLYLFYTGNVINEDGKRESYQCLAISNDGIHFEKKGPIIHVPEGYTAHFRDPKVFYKNNQWYMVIGAQTEDLKGEAVLFTSRNLFDWDFQGPLTGNGHNGLDDFGYMWECPDLFELNDKDILIVCPQGLETDGFKFNNIYQSGYFAGTIDYDKFTFEHGEFDELDRGFDFYAPQTTQDDKGRRILFGWMGNAGEETIQPTVKHEWIHALTIPRELKWENNKLLQIPVEELKSLRKEKVEHSNVVIDCEHIELSDINGHVFEMEVIVKEMCATVFSIQLGDSCKMTFNRKTNVFTFERESIKDHNKEQRHWVVETLKNIRIFKDTSSVEIFINDGEEVFTSRVFPKADDTAISFTTRDGRVQIDVKKWDLKRVFSY